MTALDLVLIIAVGFATAWAMSKISPQPIDKGRHDYGGGV